MRKVCLLIIMGILLLSCRKERTFHLTAKNAVTGQAYPGLNYYIVEEKEGYNGTNYTTLKTGTLDGNGEKMVPVKVRKNRSYVIRLDPPPNWCHMNEVSYSYTIQGDQNPTFDFTFAECAYLKLNINNVNCQGSTDYFKLYHYGSDVGFLNVSQGSPIREGAGCYSYTGNDFSNVPMGGRYYKWEVSRNGITTTFYDTLYLSPGEYRTYDINY